MKFFTDFVLENDVSRETMKLPKRFDLDESAT